MQLHAGQPLHFYLSEGTSSETRATVDHMLQGYEYCIEVLAPQVQAEPYGKGSCGLASSRPVVAVAVRVVPVFRARSASLLKYAGMMD